MASVTPLHYAGILIVPLLGSLWVAPAIADSITPARDGTGTVVQQQGDRTIITGGQRSDNGRNLFHSFTEFGLGRRDVARFLSTPEIQNILARVRGGEASYIDGLLQVTGSQANLYLLNPAGILFGPNARLDLPAAFTATTASSLGFANGAFSAVGTPDYARLVGAPTAFDFGAEPGAIANLGHLAVAPGASLSLVGGTVVNLGSLTAPGGNLTLAAIPGSHRVRLQQAGMLLSLDLEPLSSPASPLLPSPLSLPQLLTGNPMSNATQAIVQPDGTVQLSGSGLALPTGAGVAIASGRLDVSASGPGQQGGTLALVGDRIAVVGATLNANGESGGGTLLIGGEARGAGSLPNATRTLVDADSRLFVRATRRGDGGRVIAWAEEATQFLGRVDGRGGSDGGDGGFVEVSGRQALQFQGQVDLRSPLGHRGTLLLDPTNILISNGASSTGVDGELPDIFADDFPDQSITINGTSLVTQSANITLEATNQIRIADDLNLFFFPGGAITFRADADNDGVGAFVMNPANQIVTSGRDIAIFGAAITAGTIDTTGNREFGVLDAGDILLSARNDISAADLLADSPDFVGGNSGRVRLLSQEGDVTVNSISTFSNSGTGGNVVVFADLFRVLSSAGINARGGIDPSGPAGQVRISHAGGPENLPFVIGDANSVNGTAGPIVADGAPLLTGSFPVLPSNGEVVNPGSSLGITIASRNAAPTVFPSVTEFLGNQDTLVVIPFNSIFPNAVQDILDANGDRLVVQVDEIPAGGVLTLNGEVVTPGTVIQPGDVLVYSPPVGAVGQRPVFTLVAYDLNGSGGELTRSRSVEITTTLTPTPTPIPTPTPTPTPSVDDPRVDLERDRLNPPFVPPVDTPDPAIDTTLRSLDERYTQEFEEYLGLAPQPTVTLPQVQEFLSEVERATGEKPAFIYIDFVPQQVDLLPNNPLPQDSDELELVVVHATQVIRRRVPGVTRGQVIQVANVLRAEATNPRKTNSTSYLPAAQQLYQWLIAPIQADVTLEGITNLVFIAESGLRSLPFAALHDGQRFLVESYSIGITPSITLTDTLFQDVRNAQVLGIGISESTEGQVPLPAVPIELSTLVLQIWPGGRIFLNSSATLDNLRQIRQEQPFGIIHMATHADFNAGPAGNSYIQLWNRKLQMDQIRNLGWNDPPVELLVLSACRTALGDREAELGFAGLAIQTGVKTAIASLWYVSDAGTAGLMTEFYQALATASIKAEALRQAQIAMIRGEIYLEDGELRGLQGVDRLQLPSASLTLSDRQFTHPYYWAAFTVVGNPW